MVSEPRLVLVTDPMCSWCWGMTRDVESAMATLADTVHFDFMLGGINPHSTLPVGDYGRRLLRKLWADVEATTGAPFSGRFPDSYIHNSTLPCLAIEAVREELDVVPFGFLHRLQEQFFIEARNINDLELLCATAGEFGWPDAVIRNGVNSERIRSRVQFQFDNARSYGTSALPSVLLENAGKLTLLAGGYVDAHMLCSLVQARLTQAQA